MPTPHYPLWKHLGLVARILTYASIVLACMALILSIFGFDRARVPFTIDFLFVILSMIAVVFLLAICPRVVLRPRLRVAALVCPLLAATINWTNWPLYVAFILYRPWVERIADQVEANGPKRGQRSHSLQRGCVLDNGNVGLKLIGGDGGGIYFVRRAGDLPGLPNRVWYNTNWEKDLGDGWYAVYED
jgi:hypothetical protein